MLFFGSLKDHLGVYWRGCMGGLFMYYVGESYNNYGSEGLNDKWITLWIWLNVEVHGNITYIINDDFYDTL